MNVKKVLEIVKRQNYAKNGLPKFATRHSAQTGKFRKPNAEFCPLRITNASFTFTGTPFQVLFRGYQMPYKLNGNCVTVVVAEGYGGQLPMSGFSRLLTRLCTVVASTGLHFRAFHLLTSAARHDLKKTV